MYLILVKEVRSGSGTSPLFLECTVCHIVLILSPVRIEDDNNLFKCIENVIKRVPHLLEVTCLLYFLAFMVS
jgi:hypothetical protein